MALIARSFGDRALNEQLRRLDERTTSLENAPAPKASLPTPIPQAAPAVNTEIEVRTSDGAYDQQSTGVEFDAASFSVSQDGPLPMVKLLSPSGTGIPIWPRRTVTTNTTLKATDTIVQVNGAGITVTLDTVGTFADGQVVAVKSMGSAVLVATTGGVNIDGAATYTITGGNSVMLYAEKAAQWWVMANQ
jgi:hypothetical protein